MMTGHGFCFSIGGVDIFGGSETEDLGGGLEDNHRIKCDVTKAEKSLFRENHLQKKTGF